MSWKLGPPLTTGIKVPCWSSCLGFGAMGSKGLGYRVVFVGGLGFEGFRLTLSSWR